MRGCAVEVGVDLAAVVGVVAERDRVDARREHLVGVLRRDPEAAGGVLAVDDDERRRVALAQDRQAVEQRAPAEAADDVADEQDPRGARAPRSAASGSAILWRWWEAGERRRHESAGGCPRAGAAAGRARSASSTDSDATPRRRARRAWSCRAGCSWCCCRSRCSRCGRSRKPPGKVLVMFIVAGAHRADPQPGRRLPAARGGFPRGLAVLAVYLAFFLTLAGIGFLLANPISNQVRTFANNLPHTRQRSQQAARELPERTQRARHPRAARQAGQDGAADAPGQSRQERRANSRPSAARC